MQTQGGYACTIGAQTPLAEGPRAAQLLAFITCAAQTAVSMKLTIPLPWGFALTFPKTVASTLSYACAQAVESLMGAVDGSMLERLAKIMAYMRPAQAGAKPGRRLKRKDKLSMLGEAAAPPLNGGALRGVPASGGPGALLLPNASSEYGSPRSALLFVE